MMNDDAASNRRSDTALVDGWSGETVLVGGNPPAPLGADLLADPTDALARAATALAEVEHEIDLLWRETMAIEDGAASERLAEVRHAMRRASRLLEQPRAIG